MYHSPLVSVVVPVKNGGEQLRLCLECIKRSDYQKIEIIVVDDGSSDNSFKIATGFTTKTFRTFAPALRSNDSTHVQESIGPAGARNIGATHCEGEIIFFVDCDVLLNSDAISRAVNFLNSSPEYSAVFGSYDSAPSETDIISQFRNLLHHFVHQNSNEEAKTFWSGCGAIRKNVFMNINGFNSNQYPKPSVEDIELGYRLSDAGYRIFLDKELRAKHLKKWTLVNMVKTDVLFRAIPWLELLQHRKNSPNDLNLQTTHKISGCLMLCSVIIFGLMLDRWLFSTSPFVPYNRYIDILVPGIILVILLITITMISWRLCRFFMNNNGLLFTVKAIPLHHLYYFYSSLTFVFFVAKNLIINRK
jgi:glycosyltransferase involved in cell wall biosynthesis